MPDHVHMLVQIPPKRSAYRRRPCADGSAKGGSCPTSAQRAGDGAMTLFVHLSRNDQPQLSAQKQHRDA